MSGKASRVAMCASIATFSVTASAAAPAGEALYLQHCAACHQTDGSGVPGLAPPLANALGKHLVSPRGAEYMAQVVVAGLAGPITVSGQPFSSAMPGLPQLPDGEIALIINYVVRGLNRASDDILSADDVAVVRARKPGPGDTLRLRRALLGS